jgi:hypothetical protein
LSIASLLVKLRNFVSKVIAPIYKTTKWEPIIPTSVDELDKFMSYYFHWHSDPVYGLLDHIQPIGHMNYQLLCKNYIEGDCDDLATYACYMLSRMGYEGVYRVNLISHRHVICVFRIGIWYRWISNSNLTTDEYPTLTEAINGYCKTQYTVASGMYHIEKM